MVETLEPQVAPVSKSKCYFNLPSAFSSYKKGASPLLLSFCKLILLIVLWSGSVVSFGQNSSRDSILTLSAERHYQYLTEETRAFRQFIEKEREEHRRFLEQFYTIMGVVVSIVAGIVAFFGWQTRKDIKQEIEAYKEDATTKAQNELDRAQNEFIRLVNEKFQSNPLLRAAEERYQVLLDMVEQAMDLKNAEFLFIADLKNVKLEVEKLSEVNGTPKVVVLPWAAGMDLAPYDVIIYEFVPKSSGKKDESGRDVKVDEHLEQLVDALSSLKHPKPLVVYATRGKFIVDTTLEKLSSYPLHHIANNIISLIDNTASAFRVQRLTQEKRSNN